MTDQESDSKGKLLTRNWLITFGVVLTFVWLIGGISYIVFLGGWSSFVNQSADVIGGFLEGFFAPLAFLWLVIGLFIQQRELATNTEALRQTNLNSERQTEVLAATELRARQTAFFQIAENVRRQSGNLAGLLVTSLETEPGEKIVSDEEMVKHWMEHQHGQYEIFPALLIYPGGLFEREGLSQFDIYYGSASRQQTTSEYIKSFRGLLQLAKDCDYDGTIGRTITQTPHGQVYAAMLENIVPPVCWVLLEDFSPFTTPTEDIDLIGTWHVRAQTTHGEQDWFTTFRETESGVEGELHLNDAATIIQDVAVDGSALFARVVLSENLFIMTGMVEGSLLRGQIDIREGIFATFDGIRT